MTSDPKWTDSLVDEIERHDRRNPDKPSELARILKEALSAIQMGVDEDDVGVTAFLLRELQRCEWE